MKKEKKKLSWVFYIFMSVLFFCSFLLGIILEKENNVDIFHRGFELGRDIYSEETIIEFENHNFTKCMYNDDYVDVKGMTYIQFRNFRNDRLECF